jgi:hypothetical protein
MSVRAVALRLALVSMSAVSTARAEGARSDGPTGVVVKLAPCTGVDAAEVRRLVSLELAVPLVESADARGVVAVIACEGTRARVQTAFAGRAIDRNMDLASTPEAARPRVLAIAVAEGVAVERDEAPVRAEAAPAALDPAPADALPAPAPPSDAAAAWRMEVLVHERSALASAQSAWGGGVRLAWDASGIEAAIDARGDRGSASVPLGHVDVSTASLGLSLGLRPRIGNIALRGAATLRGGMRVFAGDPGDTAKTQSGSFVAASVSPGAELGADLRVGSVLVVGVTGEAGLELVPARAIVNGASQASMSGLWVGARASVGALF